jgi:hypothetical protein
VRFASDRAGRTIGGVTYHGNCLSGATYTGHMTLTNNEIKYVDKLWARAKELAGDGQRLDNVRRAELSFRLWKADNFRAEFWFLNPTKLRVNENKKLYDDQHELLATDGMKGYLTEDNSTVTLDKGLIVWHNITDWQVQPEDFYNLKLYLLYPRMWSWRQLGRDNEGNVSNLLELIVKSIL